MKAIGLKISEMDKVFTVGQMEIFIMAVGLMENEMERVFTNGKMGIFITVIGLIIKKMVLVSCKEEENSNSNMWVTL